MRSKWRSIAAGLALATAATVGTLTAAGPASADTGWGASSPADTGWGAPNTDSTDDTGWGTPPADDTSGGTTVQPYDTGWG